MGQANVQRLSSFDVLQSGGYRHVQATENLVQFDHSHSLIAIDYPDETVVQCYCNALFLKMKRIYPLIELVA